MLAIWREWEVKRVAVHRVEEWDAGGFGGGGAPCRTTDVGFNDEVLAGGLVDFHFNVAKAAVVNGLEELDGFLGHGGIEVGFAKTALTSLMGPLAEFTRGESDEWFGFGVEVGVSCDVVGVWAADQVLQDQEVNVGAVSVIVGLEFGRGVDLESFLLDVLTPGFRTVGGLEDTWVVNLLSSVVKVGLGFKEESLGDRKVVLLGKAVKCNFVDHHFDDFGGREDQVVMLGDLMAVAREDQHAGIGGGE